MNDSRDVSGACDKLEYAIPFQSMALPHSNLRAELWPVSISCFCTSFEEYALSSSGRRLFKFSFLSKSLTFSPAVDPGL